MAARTKGQGRDKADADKRPGGQHDSMSDLGLQDAAAWLETCGALLDGLVPDATTADWQAVLDLIRSSGWWYDYQQNGQSCRLPARAGDIFRRREQQATILHVRPGLEVLVNFHFFDPGTIDFDFDPRELQGQEQLNLMIHVVRLLGRRLGKRVLLGVEGCLPGQPAATYDPKSQRVQAL